MAKDLFTLTHDAHEKHMKAFPTPTRVLKKGPSQYVPSFVGGNKPATHTGYVAKAVHVPNVTGAIGTYLRTTTILSCVDNGLFAMSWWFKSLSSAYAPDGNPEIWVADPLGAYVNNMDTNPSVLQGGPNLVTPQTLSLLVKKPSASNVYSIRNNVAVFDNVWHHALCSINTNFAQGSKQGRMYIDNVDVTGVDNDFLGAFQSAYNGFLFTVFDDTFGDCYVGDSSDTWIAPGVSLLNGDGSAIPSATRALFINQTTLKPVNPINFPSGAILFSGDAATFGTNQGTGGAFTTVGAFTNASTSPSD